MTAITINDLTEATIDGSGIFDTLMRANKAHLEAEYSKNRIKGAEYATVYLGALDSILGAATNFLLQKQRVGLEADLLAQQIILAQVEVQKANLQLVQIEVQTEQIRIQTLQAIAQTSLINQQELNAVLEGNVLIAQECKLRAEYDLIITNVTKSSSEIALLDQKVTTEKAQTQSLGVDDDSVIGKQKTLYQAQTEGFKRDAEQKAAKLLIDTWNVRRTTDEGTVADGVNKLNDTTVGRTVTKLLDGVGA